MLFLTALLMSGVTNVVVVDWSVLADDADDSALTAYHHVRDHGVAAAANQAAQWLRMVIENRGIRPSDIHLVGFSLGAHVTGIIGQNLNSSVGRITGEDGIRWRGEGTMSKLGVVWKEFANRLVTRSKRLNVVLKLSKAKLSLTPYLSK